MKRGREQLSQIHRHKERTGLVWRRQGLLLNILHWKPAKGAWHPGNGRVRLARLMSWNPSHQEAETVTPRGVGGGSGETDPCECGQAPTAQRALPYWVKRQTRNRHQDSTAAEKRDSKKSNHPYQKFKSAVHSSTVLGWNAKTLVNSFLLSPLSVSSVCCFTVWPERSVWCEVLEVLPSVSSLVHYTVGVLESFWSPQSSFLSSAWMGFCPNSKPPYIIIFCAREGFEV